MKNWTEEDLYYAKVAYNATLVPSDVPWDECDEEVHNWWVEGVKAARAATYQPLALLLEDFTKLGSSPPPRGMSYVDVFARRALELGARVK
jgi:hypothetical protein